MRFGDALYHASDKFIINPVRECEEILLPRVAFKLVDRHLIIELKGAKQELENYPKKSIFHEEWYKEELQKKIEAIPKHREELKTIGPINFLKKYPDYTKGFLIGKPNANLEKEFFVGISKESIGNLVYTGVCYLLASAFTDVSSYSSMFSLGGSYLLIMGNFNKFLDYKDKKCIQYLQKKLDRTY